MRSPPYAKISIVAGLSFLACDVPVTDLPDPYLDVSPFVSPSVAGQLNANGQFVFRLDAQRPNDSEISQEQALQLAQDWVTRYVHTDWEFVEQGYGGPIDPKSLRPCGRVLYAHTPLTEPSGSVPISVRRSASSQWIVTLCGKAAAPQAWLAVSAQSLALWKEFHAGGDPERSGNHFTWRGVPGGRVDEILISPEAAVLLVGQLTNGVVESIPELIKGVAGVTWSVWRVRMQQPVRVLVEGTGAPITTSVFYVGRIYDMHGRGLVSAAPAVAVAAPVQPPSLVMRFADAPPPQSSWTSVNVAARPDAPLRLAVVTRLSPPE